MVAFKTYRFAKGKIPHCIESIGKFNAASTEINGIGSSVVGDWSSLVAVLVSVKIYKVGFGKNVMDPSSAGDLRIFVGIYTYQDCLILILPLIDELDEIVYKLCSGIWGSIALLMKQSILLIVSVVQSKVEFLVVTYLIS